ncbi:MAG: GTPase domain-containing protein [Planctomycetes bacterium]|nr:GTPase domain-containing protein [Planctomycetota bacterium]
MVQINFALREVNCKIVYYGPGMSGKTTNLEIVHKKAPESNKGELTSIATEGDRTLFFDFMPLDLGTIAGMRTRFQLYTVPGQVYYNSTRKLVLQGVDGIIFVADSSESKMDENLESLENLKNNLAEYGKDIRELPVVIQYNKRDLPDALSVEALNAKLNPWGAPYFEAVAITGEGVFPTLKCLSGMVLETLNRDHRETPAQSARPAAAASVNGATGTAVATPPAATSSTASSRSSISSPGDPPRPHLRAGSGMEQITGAVGSANRPQVKSGPATSHAGSPHNSANQTGRHRKVEATPLQQSIRTTPQGAPAAHGRKVELPAENKFPWIMVGLVVLIAGAAAAILGSLGTFGGGE